MKNCTKVLGKVSISVEGNWDINKKYDRLCLVKNKQGGGTYLSKVFVPKGINIENEDYWLFLCGEGSINNLVSFDIQIVEQLPSYGSKGIMYLVKEDISENNIYSEYIWISNEQGYEKLGSFDSDVFTTFKNEITKEFEDFKEEIEDFKEEINSSNETFKQEINNDNQSFKEEINNTKGQIVNDYIAANIAFEAVGSQGTLIGTMKAGSKTTQIYVPIKRCTEEEYNANVKEDVLYFIID